MKPGAGTVISVSALVGLAVAAAATGKMPIVLKVMASVSKEAMFLSPKLLSWNTLDIIESPM